MSSYAQEVAHHFLQFPAEEFGQASTPEFQKEARRALGEYPPQSHIELNKRVSEHGIILPEIITPEMVAIAGGSHGCPVTISLAESRGPEGAADTVRSYLTKIYFDVATHTSVNTQALETWLNPVERQPGFSNPAVQYPNGVDTSLIHGMAAPHRFLPSQLYRTLELFRLGLLDDATQEKTGLDAVSDRNAGKISFSILDRDIRRARTGTEVAGMIGANIARQLLTKESPLTEKQVVLVLKAAFDGHGIAKEHGFIPEVGRVHEALAEKIGQDKTTKHLALDLSV